MNSHTGSCNPHAMLLCSETSKQQNDQRLKMLAARQGLIRDVFEEAKAQIKKQVKSSGYTDMVATLLCQVRTSQHVP
jgi:ATP synthase (E/31 kDa) subunit